MGIIDFITGHNPNQGAINQATNASNQATAAQNQLIQQALLPAYNSMLQSWNQYYAPLQGGAMDTMSGILGGNQIGAVGSQIANVGLDPSQADAFSSVPLTAVGNEAINYEMNPGGTLSNRIAPGVVGSYLNPNTSLARLVPGALNLFGSEVSGQGPGQGTLGQQALGIAPGQEVFLNMAAHGLSPESIAAAINAYRAPALQSINTIANRMGATVPNAAGVAENLGLNAMQGLAGLGSSLAGQNQNAQVQGASSLLNSQAAGANNLFNTVNQGASAGLNAAGALDTQRAQRLAAALEAAGGLDQQTLSMLNTGVNTGSQLQGNRLNTLFNSGNTQQNLLNSVLNYIASGRNVLGQGVSGMNNLAGMYGGAANQQANNAMGLINSGNAANSNTFSGLAGLAGAAFGAGLF